MKKIIISLSVVLGLVSCTNTQLMELSKRVDRIEKTEFVVENPISVNKDTEKLLIVKMEQLKESNDEKIEQLKRNLDKLNTEFSSLKKEKTTLSLEEFKLGDSKLTEAHKSIIVKNIEEIRKSKDIVIVGYADTTGDYVKNLELGLNRARETKKYLENLGIKNISIYSSGANTIKDSKIQSLNRRVEIIF